MNELSATNAYVLDQFKLRPYQLPLWDAVLSDKYRKFMALWCRRSGKDITAWNLIIRLALKKVGVYFYCLPTYRQARIVIFDSITNDNKRFIDFIPKELIYKINVQEMKIMLVNGSLIQCIGSDNYDTSLIGTNPQAVVFSEMALSDERAYQYIRPIMNANMGKVIILSTPRGHNHFFTLYEIARSSPDWFCQKLTVTDCGHIPLHLIERDIASGEMSEDMADAEYYCSFNSGVEGSYYGKYIDRMRLNNQITTVPWEPGFAVHSSWDIGFRDSTSIIFFQNIGTTVRIIDCYEKSKEGLEYYINVLKSKPYTWGKHIAPHDIGVSEYASGQTRWAKAKQLGINFTLSNNVSIMDGIESCRSAFARIWIDEVKCAPLIKALENYRQEYDSKRKVYLAKPLHDWSSHFCFIGETLISTDKGNIPIKDIQPGMVVKTPFGLRKVLAINETTTEKLVDINVNNKIITCTPDHQIFTERGLVDADSLQYNDILEHNSVTRRYIWQMIYGLFLKENVGDGFKSLFLFHKTKTKSALMDTFLRGMDHIIKEEQNFIQHCKEQFGCITVGRSHLNMLFTILTAINETIQSKIFKCSVLKNIFRDMLTNLDLGHIHKPVKTCCTLTVEKQLNGTDQMKDVNGTGAMQKHCLFIKALYIPLFVLRAIINFLAKWFGLNFVLKNAIQAGLDGAQSDITAGIITETTIFIEPGYYTENLTLYSNIHPSKNINIIRVKMTKIVCAVYAKVYSFVINTVLRRHVVLNVRAYQLSKPRLVYDLTIENDHCFYANGYLVSNCDSFRYLCVSLPKTRDSLSAEELDRRYQEAIMGPSGNIPKPFRENPW